MLCIFFFRGICSNCTDDPVKDRLDACFQPLSAAYKKICEEQAKINKAFFGLRDFYRYDVYSLHEVNFAVYFLV